MDGLAARHADLTARYRVLGRIHAHLVANGHTQAANATFASLTRIFREASDVYDQIVRGAR